MDALQWLLWSVLLYCVGAMVSLVVTERQAIVLAGASAILAGAFGVCSALPVLVSGEVVTLSLTTPFAFADLVLRMDSLAALMVLVISLLAMLCALYSFSYVREYQGRGAVAIGFFMNLFIASMVALMVMDNAFWFLVLFEMMSLASWFLVIAEQDEESIRAGWLYFFIAHLGSVLIMVAFLLMWRQSGSLDFSSFRHLALSPKMASLVFLLAFFGFGAKAGMLPLHSWLPRAHPAAPSHASAMMSGVMVKIGIFGIIKVGIDLLGATQVWWGILVLAFGAVSAVLGVLYALAEQDIKRLLAWSTVENVGIILMGVGAGMTGIALQMPVLAVVGLLGALMHLLNHALFKGLLFLGAGAVIYRVHNRSLSMMGGLGKLMPWTAGAVLLGCMAIAALPPLNGFISEWYTYQSLFAMAKEEGMLLRLAGPLAIVMLAITGALAALCFVRLYGFGFCGAPRSPQAQQAREVPWPMWLSLLLLALLCLLLGVGSVLIVPCLVKVVWSLSALPPVLVAQGWSLMPGSSQQAIIAPPLIFILLLTLPLLPGILWWRKRHERGPFRHQGDPWACGYQWQPEMTLSARGAVQPIRVMFSWLYQLRTHLDPSPVLNRCLQRTVQGAGWVEPLWDLWLIQPLVRGVQRAGTAVQRLQSGDMRLYCLYVVAALLCLLLFVAW
ncbi:MAG: hydrogenase 4 subunit B [Enterobacteriaceae bacterium]